LYNEEFLNYLHLTKYNVNDEVKEVESERAFSTYRRGEAYADFS
jgi:hypothetical protein